MVFEVRFFAGGEKLGEKFGGAAADLGGENGENSANSGAGNFANFANFGAGNLPKTALLNAPDSATARAIFAARFPSAQIIEIAPKAATTNAANAANFVSKNPAATSNSNLAQNQNQNPRQTHATKSNLNSANPANFASKNPAAAAPNSNSAPAASKNSTKPPAATQTSPGIFAHFRPKKLRFKSEHFTLCIRQIAVMLAAGISLDDALAQAQRSAPSRAIAELFARARAGIAQGQPLSETLAQNGANAQTTAFVRLGETGGDLAGSFTRLAALLDENEANKRAFKQALRYPLMLAGATFAAFFVVMKFVVGEFAGMFAGLGAALPLPTRALLAAHDFVGRWGAAMAVAVLAAGVAVAVCYIKFAQIRIWLDGAALRVPILRRVIISANLARYFLVAAELLKSGVEVFAALQIAAGALSNAALRRRFGAAGVALKGGADLAGAFAATRACDGVVLALIAAGEKSGNAGEMLARAAALYAERFGFLSRNISALIEPLFLVVLGGFVLVLALGIFMPMWELGGAAAR